jgi:hypothetical protein
MSREKPTIEELEEAENYALSVLCTEIPKTVGMGLTRWDSNKRVCNITKKGCDPFARNGLLSIPKYDPNTGKDDYVPRVVGRNRKSFMKYWDPDFYVWKRTKKSNKEVCARGNFLLYQWCEFPESRAPEPTKGVTNAPPFEYNIRSGKETCDIPKSYCDDKGVSYDSNIRDCYVSAGQKHEEFWASPVLVRNANRKSDSRLKTDIVVEKYNWLGKGIHFYRFTWRPIATKLYGLQGDDAGVLADDFPSDQIYIDEHGYKSLKLELDTYPMNILRNFFQMKNGLENIMLIANIIKK